MADTQQPPDGGDDVGAPQFAYHAVFEPIMIVGIMVGSCYFTRLRGFSIRPPKDQDQDLGLLGRRRRRHSKPDPRDSDSSTSNDDAYDGEHGLALFADVSPTATHPPKKRSCCGTVVYTPNSSRYANYWHSRFLQKFPFLLEMFYWAVNLGAYASIKNLSELIFATDNVWQMAEGHGVNILWAEQEGPFSFLFPLREVDVQHFFRNGHQTMLTVLNRAYSLIHIPVTVTFLAWYYYAAPTHAQFASARRMMSLTNFVSFVVFTTYPCMPPRLLPEKYGFFDTVRHEDAESIYATNKFFNQLAAFPSLHFGYSFCIATVLLHYSGILRRRLGPREQRMSKVRQTFFAVLSVVYPAFVLLIIVSTANHYWLDALAATGVVLMAWLLNPLLNYLIPLEDLLLWVLKLEKPIPTTGYRRLDV